MKLEEYIKYRYSHIKIISYDNALRVYGTIKIEYEGIEFPKSVFVFGHYHIHKTAYPNDIQIAGCLYKLDSGSIPKFGVYVGSYIFYRSLYINPMDSMLINGYFVCDGVIS